MMTPLAIALSVLPLAQDPEVQPETPSTTTAAPTNLDIIVLKNGETFEGLVLTELDGYVEFKLDGGSIVGVGKKQVAEIKRGAGARIAPVRAMLKPRDEWFLLYDAYGDSVGWLHATVVIGADSGITASEEYEFLDGNRRYHVTSQCTADALLQPRSCYFRERTSEPMLAISSMGSGAGPTQPDRIIGERIVDARCSDAQLVVIRTDSSGRRSRTYDWAENATFPLLARISARSNGEALDAVPMFDPATEEIVARSIEGKRRRTVTLGGKTREVTEIVESGVNTKNSVWIDASLRTIRREIAGPSLVAVLSNSRSAKARVGRATIAPAMASEVDGSFGLWVPNPAWRAEEELDPGQIALVCEAHGATIGLTRVAHLEPGTSVVMAAEAVTNWFRLLHPDLRIIRRETVMIRDRRSMHLIAESRRAIRSERATIDIIPHNGNFLVLVCRAPRIAWAELAADFAFVRRTAELDPQSVEPPLQGPLLDQQRRQAKRKSPRAAPSAQRPSSRRQLPTVKIPGLTRR